MNVPLTVNGGRKCATTAETIAARREAIISMPRERMMRRASCRVTPRPSASMGDASGCHNHAADEHWDTVECDTAKGEYACADNEHIKISIRYGRYWDSNP